MADLTPRPDAVPPLVPGRSCKDCTLCCKLVSVYEIEKPAQSWCEHCTIGVGCRIYDMRPADCRTFYCGWLLDPRISDAWEPNKCKMVVKFEPKRIVIHVDRDRRDQWRKEPYHSQIRAWAQAGMAYQGEVIVWEGLEALRIHPAGEQRLGRAAKR
jgi:hypothetical protein